MNSQAHGLLYSSALRKGGGNEKAQDVALRFGCKSSRGFPGSYRCLSPLSLVFPWEIPAFLAGISARGSDRGSGVETRKWQSSHTE